MASVVQIQDFHEKHGHLTEFAGFTLPLWFKGIIPEALAVRNSAGIFDVSHMGRAIIAGSASQPLLDKITTNDVASLKEGQGQYSLICNPGGGIMDDVLVFRLKAVEYLIVYNAGNRSKDYEWIMNHARQFGAAVEDVSDKVAMFAVQGPKSKEILQQLSSEKIGDIPRFGCWWTEISGVKSLVSRTGYTGEDGFEVFVWDSPLSEPQKARKVWDEVLRAGRGEGLEPCGLGARDLLRLEAGLCLYGSDMDEATNPYEARLGFVVKMNKDFIGKENLQRIKESGPSNIRIGLVTARRVIPRHGFAILDHERDVGKVTSGTLSPLLNTGIAMGYVKADLAREGLGLQVQVRERLEEIIVVKPPFYDTTKYGYSRKS